MTLGGCFVSPRLMVQYVGIDECFSQQALVTKHRTYSH
jgi:hypothetical protein